MGLSKLLKMCANVEIGNHLCHLTNVQGVVPKDGHVVLQACLFNCVLCQLRHGYKNMLTLRWIDNSNALGNLLCLALRLETRVLIGCIVLCIKGC